MSFDALPDDIILAIVAHAYSRARNIIEWRRQLPALSVCQRIRYLALPTLYCNAFIAGSLERTRYGDIMAISTNVDIAAETGNLHFIRTLDIKAPFEHRGRRGLAKAVNTLTPYSGRLDAIAELSIALQFNNVDTLDTAAELQPADSLIAREAEEFVCAVPGIQYLSSGGLMRGSITEAFYWMLMRAYADKLLCVTYHGLLEFPPSLTFSQITNLTIQLDFEFLENIPRVCSDTIQELHITNLPAAYTWKLFGFDGIPETMSLPNIVNLYISYAYNSPLDADFDFESAQQCKIHAPKLRNLELYGKDLLPFLYSAVLPERVKSIVVEANATAISRFQTAVLPKVDWLSIRINDDDVSLPNLYRTINSLVNSAHARLEACITVASAQTAMDSGSIRCPSLKNLTVDSKVDPATLIGIIANNPSLEFLSIVELATNNLPAGVVVPDQHSAGLLPLNSKLEVLFLKCGSAGTANDVYLTIAKYLVLSLPRLETITAENILGDIWNSFISEFGPSYPHLAAIKIK